VLEAVVVRQQEFLRRGPRFLRPLTRAQIAREVGVHESTVGRAVADRHAILPSGRLAPVSHFFMASRGPEAALAELVAGESRPKPDGELAGELAGLGFKVARRTVAKYRDRLGIPPHFLR
jgi:RNA polymerase sigma-54 factor